KRIQWRGLTHGLQQLDGRSFTGQEHLTNALSGILNERPPREPTVQRPHRDEKSFNARDSHPDVVQDESTFQSRLLLLPCPPSVTGLRWGGPPIIPIQGRGIGSPPRARWGSRRSARWRPGAPRPSGR